MQETKLDKTVKFRCSFIELMDHLEKISIDYVNINIFNNFIYMDQRNEFNYKISNVINSKEVYKFQYFGENKENHDIPNAIFIPEYLYDFELDLDNKKFKKFCEFKIEEIIEILNLINNNVINNNIINNNHENKQKNKSLIRKIFGC